MGSAKSNLMMLAFLGAVISSLGVPARAGNVTVHIVDFAYSPETVEIQVGDTVTWINDDDDDHTATRTDAEAFTTGRLTKGQSKAIKFVTASPPEGYQYFCIPHPFMKGHVVVRQGGIHLAKMESHKKASDSEPASKSTVRAAQTVTVHIVDFAYSPETVEIQVGDTVTWINDGDDDHTATRTDAEAFDTGFLGTGKSNSHVFRTASSATGFEYTCTPHPFMKGRIVVKLPGSHLAGMKHK